MAELLDSWRRSSGLLIAGMISLTNMAGTALPSMIPLFLTGEHGLSPERVGLTFSVLLGAGAVLQPWVGKVSDRSGRCVFWCWPARPPCLRRPSIMRITGEAPRWALPSC
jgi:MFS family permease